MTNNVNDIILLLDKAKFIADKEGLFVIKESIDDLVFLVAVELMNSISSTDEKEKDDST